MSTVTGFPLVNAGMEIHRTADGGYLLVGAHRQFEVEEFFLRFLELADGTRPSATIAETFTEELGPLFGPTFALKALNTAVEAGLCTIVDRPLPEGAGIGRLTGSRDGYHPMHATLEIIETCNFTCEHCYYSSSPLKKGRLDLQQATELMDLMAERGVRVIELTGGECTIHPDFREILARAADRFVLVAVISNGYLLGTRPSLREHVASFDNVAVQISIDGLEKHHDTWRRHKGSFAAATTAARELALLGVPVRVASTITENNLHEIKPLFELVRSLGVAAAAFSPVAALGRGCNVSDPGMGSEDLVREINEQLAAFAQDPLLTKSPPAPTLATKTPTLNCGAGSRSYAIDYDGNVRACNFSRDSKKFGNLLNDSYDTVFNQEANFLFRNAPSPGGAECQGCDYYHYCRGCFVKAFMTSEEHYPACPWRKKWFPGMPLGLDPDRKPASRKLLPLMVEPAQPEFHHCGCGPSGN
ncbi:radical SAM protein [Streptomyces sp. NPDC127114]|uniref:radical SAM protein n=1 Tax=Streptomyces sp. NPDC127114 TaxID=3345366 RepID=UPI00362BD377